MIAPRHPVVDVLRMAYREGQRLLLLFDYDGTLVPIAEHPRLARLAGPTRRVLARLAGQPRVRVGIVSGRSLDDLRHMVCLSDVCLVGTTGLEMEAYGVRLVHREARKAIRSVGEAIRAVRAAIAPFRGAWVEDKRLGLTVHYRRAAPEGIVALRDAAHAALAPHARALRIVEGPMAMEVTPNVGCHKGTAVRMIQERLKPARHLVVYAGDSANDADALEEVGAAGGIGLGIGPEAPRIARYRLPDPAALGSLLDELWRALGAESKPRRPRAMAGSGGR